MDDPRDRWTADRQIALQRSAPPAEQGTPHIAQQIRDAADMGKIYKRMEEAAGSQFGRVQLSQHEIGVVLRTLHDYHAAKAVTPEQLAQRIYDAAEKVVITEEPLHFVRKVPTPHQIADILRDSHAAVSAPASDCQHEPYYGRCVYCGVIFVGGMPSASAPEPEARELAAASDASACRPAGDDDGE